MPSPTEPHLPTENDAPVPDETTLTNLTVTGALPLALSGQYLRIGPNPITPSATAVSLGLDGMVHAVDLRAGRAVAYRNRWVVTDEVARTLGTEPTPGPPASASDVVATNVIAFGGRTLALGPGALAYELDEHLTTVRRVDLAGHGRGIGAHPELDPISGALHLVSYGETPAHHRVAPSSHTRVTVPVPDAPGPLHDLLLSRERLVVFGDGFAGIADRATSRGRLGRRRSHRRDRRPQRRRRRGGPRSCSSTDAMGPQRNGRRARGPRRHTPAVRFQESSERRTRPVCGPSLRQAGRRCTGTTCAPASRTNHDFGTGRHPGELTFVADPARRHREDGGWLVGFVHRSDGAWADLTVLDAAAIDRPPVATVRIPDASPTGSTACGSRQRDHHEHHTHPEGTPDAEPPPTALPD